LTIAAAGVAVIVAFVVGLFTYMNATATPLHPDPQKVAFVTGAAPSARWAGAVEQGRQTARAAVSRQNLPGLSIAVGSGGEIVWAEAFGFADIDKRTPLTPETRLRIGDASMALTSAAVGLLVEQRRLNLESDIHSYVPEFPEKQWPVTLRELMGHVGGVRGDAGDEEPLDERCDRTVDGIRRFKDSPLRFEPGTRYAYSTYGWILVSAAVEAAAGEPFFTLMRTKIFDPLRMTATRPYRMADATPDLATFYFPKFAGDPRYGPELAREGDHACFAGAGAFLSTPSDLVRFGMAMSGGTLLRRATVDELLTPQRLASGEQTHDGLGWTLDTLPLGGAPARTAGHGTKVDFIGGSTFLMTFPDRGLVVAAITNESFADMKSIAASLAQAFAAVAPAAAK
jgi:CubicO group peptidase (beta-lactamase class C family)